MSAHGARPQRRARWARFLDACREHARRVVALVVGTTLVLIGLALLFLPGPGLVILAAGLAVLAAEFAWARHWLRKVRERLGHPPRW